MTRFVELQTFYKNINQSAGSLNNEVGHFNMFRIEDILSPKNKQTQQSRRNFFKISLITGKNKLHYADRCIEVKDSALVFTNPMIPYLWERLSEEQVGYVCVFTEAFFSRFGNIKDWPVYQSPELSIIPLTIDETSELTSFFERMYGELRGDYAYKYDLLRHLVMEIIHVAQKKQPAPGTVSSGSNASERIAALFAELLERQFPIIESSDQVIQLKSPSDFARQLNVHVNHLNKSLKETTGQTTSQLINERVLTEARVLLKSTNWTINNIAWALGFEEPNHFSSFFKSRLQLSPKQFRQAQTD